MPETVRCPKCGSPVEIAAALAAQVRSEVEARQQEETQRLVREAAAKAASETRERAARDALLLREQLETARKERDAAQAQELALRAKREEVEQREKALDLTVARRVDEETRRARETARKEADDAHALKDKEQQALVEGMKRTIEELKRKAEQGSQQLQGEVLETSLEDLLRKEFPGDAIEPVPKGVKGADVIQRVRAGAHEAGVILWESKRTKGWNDAWLPKLRDDQRELKADLAALVSQTLAAGARPIEARDGTWVSSFACATGLAHALRRGLLETAEQRRAAENRTDKEALLYAYLTGREFKGRMEGLLEPFLALKDDLEAEKRAVLRLWEKREHQIQRALRSLAGMQGDLEGIAGKVLPGLDALALPGSEGDAKPA
jgi:hypothetical protein